MHEKISLSNDSWILREISRNDFLSPNLAEKYLKPNPLPKENDMQNVHQFDQIYSAIIPGNVRLDLLNAGIIPDPFIAMQNEQSQWVSDKYWLYQTTFFIPHTKKNKRVFLNFNKTDYYSSFFLDEHHLGRHKGMFSPANFEITELVSEKLSQNNPLEDEKGVPFTITVLLGAAPQKRWQAVKCQMSYHWDFAPKIETIGIWDDVEVTFTDEIALDDIFCYAQIGKIEGIFGYETKFHCELSLNLDLSHLSGVYQCKINFPELEIHNEFPLSLVQNKEPVKLELLIPKVELWFPNAAGAQKLYDYSIEIVRNNEVILDYHPSPFGFRKIKMKYNPKTPAGNEKWTFVINNRPEFIRGANWVPSDSLFGRSSESHYEELILAASEANVNMFRIWGGGILEKQSFFELCNRYGILVWHEFPFACSNYPADPIFLKTVKKESIAIVKAIRNHASVVAYVGGNEWNPRFNKHLVEILKNAAGLDPTRIFYDVSPTKGDLHDWAVWHAKADFDAYRVGEKEETNAFQFFSEFGLQSAPAKETMLHFLPSDKRWPPNEHFTYHHAELRKLDRYGRCVCKQDSLDAFIYGTQVAQAEGMKFGIEYCRMKKPEMSGVLFWQWNEPWPAICWSVIDYYGRPKIAYEYLKEIYQPLILILNFTRIDVKTGLDFEVHCVNDFHRSYQNVAVQISLTSRTLPQPLSLISTSLDISPDSSLLLTKYNWNSSEILLQDLSLAQLARVCISASLIDEVGKEISTNHYYPFRYRERQSRPHFVNELSAKGAYLVNEKFWFIYEMGRKLGIDNL